MTTKGLPQFGGPFWLMYLQYSVKLNCVEGKVLGPLSNFSTNPLAFYHMLFPDWLLYSLSIWQIDSMLPCVCSVRTTKYRLVCHFSVLTTFWRLLIHEIRLFNIIKKQTTTEQALFVLESFTITRKPPFSHFGKLEKKSHLRWSIVYTKWNNLIGCYA